MAKRKRLGPAAITGQGDEQALTGQIDSVFVPPIARVAGDAAAGAAARELADELANARAEGRMVLDLAFEQIDETHLSRDRVCADETELEALAASISARGQQMPIEVIDKWAHRPQGAAGQAAGQAEGPDDRPEDQDGPAGRRYGLISGWRRLTVLRRLAERDPDQPRTVKAILRQPVDAAEAYLSMVEENELRVGIGYYERAQVAARAAQAGVFASSSEAIRGLFPTASKAKWSKIGAFVRIFMVLDAGLRFPEAISERLGLRIAKALDDGKGPWLYAGLQESDPQTPAEEQALLERLLTGATGSKAPSRVDHAHFPGDVKLVRTKGALKLVGTGVDASLTQDLTAWLRKRQTPQG